MVLTQLGLQQVMVSNCLSSSCVIETVWEWGHYGHETSKESQVSLGRICQGAFVFHMLLFREYDHSILSHSPGRPLHFCAQRKRSGQVVFWLKTHRWEAAATPRVVLPQCVVIIAAWHGEHLTGSPMLFLVPCKYSFTWTSGRSEEVLLVSPY